MPTALIYFEEDENKILIKLSEKLKISKHDVVKKLVKMYGNKLLMDNEAD